MIHNVYNVIMSHPNKHSLLRKTFGSVSSVLAFK